jgi:hypothetical protein
MEPVLLHWQAGCQRPALQPAKLVQQLPHWHLVIP